MPPECEKCGLCHTRMDACIDAESRLTIEQRIQYVTSDTTYIKSGIIALEIYANRGHK